LELRHENKEHKPMGNRRDACAKPRASRGVLRHASRGSQRSLGSTLVHKPIPFTIFSIECRPTHSVVAQK